MVVKKCLIKNPTATFIVWSDKESDEKKLESFVGESKYCKCIHMYVSPNEETRTNCEYSIRTPKGVVDIKKGDYIIKNCYDELSVMNKNDFFKRFEEVK